MLEPLALGLGLALGATLPAPVEPLAPVGFAQAVARALAAHPSLRIAEQSVSRAEALVVQARAPSLPSLTAGLTATLLDAERRLQDRVIAGREQLSGNVTLSAPLVAPARWAQWRRAAEGSEITRAEARDVRRQVALAAARAWLAVLAQRRALEVAARAVDTAGTHLEFATARGAGGLGNRLEELRAAQELSAAQAQRATAAGQLARAREALGVALAADGPVDIAADEPTLDAPDEEAAALDAVSERRSDVVAARARSDAATAASTLDWTDWAPLLQAVVQPFTQQPPTLTQPSLGWQAQLVLTLPLFEGGLRAGQARERAAARAVADAQLELALRAARSELRAAFEGVRRADEVLAAARASAEHAAQALELANAAWHAGTSTNLEVIDAERRARDAATQAAIAEDAARQARLDVLVASGRFPGR